MSAEKKYGKNEGTGKMKLSVLMPAYNEVHTLMDIISRLEKVDIEKELVIVDDCSTDGTRELLKKNFGDGKLGVKVIYHEKNMGKGKAIRSAIENAAGDFCVIQDAD
ncbi:MAG: glycosyltransferase family 2 protein, partial [Candidatus Omnitrophota bacterium]